MILSIESSIPTFKALYLHEGLNVLLADTRPESTQKQTRNSAGKTSLVEIVHFIFGADCDPASLFRSKELIEHNFTGTFTIRGDKFVVSRSGSDPSKIFLREGGENRPEIPTKRDKESELTYVSNVNWRIFLGHEMFGMPADIRGTIYDESFTPTFRAMFAYFARRRDSGAFLSAERQAEKQQRGDWQVNLSYLLGLDWRIPFEFQKVRGRERTLEELKKAAKSGAFGKVLGTVADLRPQLKLAESKAEKLIAQLSAFEVLESYKDLSRRAAQAKNEMQSIARDAVLLNETLEHLEAALRDEQSPDKANVQRIFAAAGVELPGVVLRRIEEVTQFHESVVKNRRSHLEKEIRDVRKQIEEGDARLKALDSVRSKVMMTLDGKGALEDFVQLQREVAEAEALAASLREQFKAAKIIEGEATQLDIDRANLKRRLQEDHSERSEHLGEAILTIAEFISELYDDRTGRFVVEATDNGPEFRIAIEGDRGGGIANIEIFCLDLALFRLVTKRFGGPEFLLHDSHLFDGVDERQIARALLLGARETKGRGKQYIVTMNSDIFDRLPLPAEINREHVVLSARLSDETDTGGLFGFRFD